MPGEKEKARGKGAGRVLVFVVLLALILLAVWVWTRPASRHAAKTSTAEVATTEPAAAVVPATVRIASWNILNLGKKTPVDERAEIIAQFDIVALQEVESTEGLERLRKKVEDVSGVSWGQATSPKVGEGNAAEYYVFLYRNDRVKEVAQGPRGVFPEASPTDFSREPFFATFKAGNFDFTLVTIHVTFASGSAITAEVGRLADVWTYVQDLDTKEDDVLLMGDFNRDKPTHTAFSRLKALGVTNVIAGDGVFTTFGSTANKVGSSWYDNIWIDRKYTAHEFSGRFGVDPIHLRYFQNSEHPHLEVRKRISDHCPVWAEFDVSQADDD